LGPADGSSGEGASEDGASGGGFEDEATTSSGGDPSASAGPESEPASCEAEGGRCVAVPPGWDGPVALLPYGDGESEPRCGPPYPRPIDRELGADLIGTELTCDCACGPAQGATCQGTASVHYTDDPATSSCDDGETLLMSSLAQEGGVFGSGMTSWSATPAASTVVGGTCGPVASVTMPEPRFASGVVACAPAADDGTCGDGLVCEPSASVPFDGATCVWRDGDEPCPAGEYVERHVYHRDVVDDRACPTCACEPPAGACAGPTLRLAYWFVGPDAAAGLLVRRAHRRRDDPGRW
jgi:hypothetical protein